MTAVVPSAVMKLQSLTLTIATTASISLAGVTLTTSSSDPFVLTYDSDVLDLSGSAKVLLPGTSGSISVSATGTIVNRYLTQFHLDGDRARRPQVHDRGNDDRSERPDAHLHSRRGSRHWRRHRHLPGHRPVAMHISANELSDS